MISSSFGLLSVLNELREYADTDVWRQRTQSCPWVGLTHGLDWVGLGWVGLGWVEIFQFLVGWVGSTTAKVLKIRKDYVNA